MAKGRHSIKEDPKPIDVRDIETLPSERRRKAARAIAIIGIIIGYGLLATLVMLLVRQSGTYPDGADTMFYVYRGDLMYRSIVEQGNWFPLLDMAWYNGVQPMRYWSPLSSYIFAACQAIAGGNLTDGYLVFVWLLVFTSGCVWLRIGCTHNRPWMGAVLGALWFFVPNNLFMLIAEGVVVRNITCVVLPLYFSYVYDYLKTARWQILVKMIIVFVFIIMCHTGWAGMIAITLVIFTICYYIVNRKRDRAGSMLAVFGSMIGSFLITGIWLVPSLIGGITSTDSSQIMATYFQSLNISLNPFYTWMEGLGRWANGNGLSYFGIVTFLLCILGIFLSGKRTGPGFCTALIICLLTSTLFYPLLAPLPGGQYLWMLRFVSIALCLALVSFFFWDKLRPALQIFVVVALILDAAPAFSLITVYGSGTTPQQRYDKIESTYLIDVAKSNTEQRMHSVEPGGSGMDALYTITGYGDDAVWSSDGRGIQSAITASNIVQINQAGEDGSYLYMFDRCIELGDDVVLIPMTGMKNGLRDSKVVDEAAATVGYDLLEKTEIFHLYKLKGAPSSFGVISDYPAIGIGDSAPSIALNFPSVEETTDPDLSHYTFEELSKYEIVFLDHFTYSDQEAAEDLVIRLSEAGTRVVISSDGVPSDERTGKKTFLGCDMESITFTNGYPALHTIDGTLYCDLFPAGYGEWKTTFVNGLDNVWGTIDEDDRTLDFYGTVKNDNIVIIGLNLEFFYGLTHDPGVGTLLEHAYALSPTRLPERTLVPISITYEPNRIIIESEYDNVNTNIAYQDIFESDQPIWDQNHLLYVNKGTTYVHYSYPYFWPGLACTFGGIVYSILFVVIVAQSRKFRGRRVTKRDRAHILDTP